MFNFNDKPYQLFHGDCLAVMEGFVDKTIDAIITDPPYFGILNTDWDNQWINKKDFIRWFDQLCSEWQRILKDNGTLYCFASPEMASHVEVKIGEYFNVLNHIVWKKTEKSYMAKTDAFLRRFVPTSERIIFAEQFNENGLEQSLNLSVNSAREYIRNEIVRARGTLSLKEINQALGTATNGGGVASSILSLDKAYPNFITQENYEKLKTWLNKNGGDFLNKNYAELRETYESLRLEHEQLRRAFDLTVRDKHTDVWEFISDNSGKFHECEKPQNLMRHIVKSSTKPDQIVLDCFLGSGSTGLACLGLNRKFIGIEKDRNYFEVATARIKRANLEPCDIPQRQGIEKELPLFEV